MAPRSLPEGPPGGSPPPPGGHFRAHPRRAVRLDVTLEVSRVATPLPAALVDVSLAGAGLELDLALVVGEVVRVVMATPTLWDPLVVPATVAWSRAASPFLHPAADGGGRFLHPAADGGGPRPRARAGVRFDHPTPESTFATWEMLSTLVFD